MRFASAAERAAFIEELTAGITGLIRKYDAPDAEGAGTTGSWWPSIPR